MSLTQKPGEGHSLRQWMPMELVHHNNTEVHSLNTSDLFGAPGILTDFEYNSLRDC